MHTASVQAGLCVDALHAARAASSAIQSRLVRVQNAVLCRNRNHHRDRQRPTSVRANAYLSVGKCMGLREESEGRRMRCENAIQTFALCT